MIFINTAFFIFFVFGEVIQQSISVYVNYRHYFFQAKKSELPVGSLCRYSLYNKF